MSTTKNFNSKTWLGVFWREITDEISQYLSALLNKYGIAVGTHQVISYHRRLIILSIELESDCRVFGSLQLTLHHLSILLYANDGQPGHPMVMAFHFPLSPLPIFFLLVMVTR